MSQDHHTTFFFQRSINVVKAINQNTIIIKKNNELNEAATCEEILWQFFCLSLIDKVNMAKWNYVAFRRSCPIEFF